MSRERQICLNFASHDDENERAEAERQMNEILGKINAENQAEMSGAVDTEFWREIDTDLEGDFVRGIYEQNPADFE